MLAGRYEIEGLVGIGGMGEVYRARDPRLARSVAVKVLPPGKEDDPDRLRRLEQEARVAGGLNHPNILAVHDVGSHTGAPFVVSELLVGGTLRDKLSQGALGMQEALDYGVQLARGLAAAHEQGIVHRDLKPENLFITTDGRLKILDFGIAKRSQPAAAVAVNTDAKTETQGAGTAPGAILGTVGYMAPEQVTGKPADERSDIFAFGAVLYEMISGHRAFKGETPADTLVEILTKEPPAVPGDVGATSACLAIVKRCLEKNPGRRFRSAHDLGFALETLSGVSPLPPARPRTASRLARLSLWTLATAAAVIAGIAGTRRAPALGIPTPKRFAVPLAGLDFEVEQYFAIAPDGSSLVYGGGRRLEQPLSLYDLRDGSTRTIPGTGAAAHPFFSPDGRWLGFFQALKLKKVALGGGSPVTLCDSPGSVASWGADDRILGGAARSDAGGLWQVPAAGGRRQPLTKLSIAAREAAHSTPRLMPDGDSVLFTISGGDDVEASQIALLSLRDGSYRTLLRGGANARYSPTGHLVYTRGNDLMAVPFDARRLAVTGAPSVALTGLRRLVDSENSFDLATDGTLAFIAGGGTELRRTLVWVDAGGATRPLPFQERAYLFPVLLPGAKEAIVETAEAPHTLWRGDLGSGALTQLTREGANHRPVVSPDGKLMAFSSDRVVPRSLFLQATDGSGKAEQLTHGPAPHDVTSWSADGRYLAFTERSPETGLDIWVLPLQGERRPRPFIKTSAGEDSAVFSPDGRWIAYVSNESGRFEVLVTAFPGPGPRKQISTSGGEMPVFARDGGLLYRHGDQVLRVTIGGEPSLHASAPSVAFTMPRSLTSLPLPNFALSPDGRGLLTVRYPDAVPQQMTVVVNWFDELRRLTAAPR